MSTVSFGIDLKPLERGMDALVRMANALELLAQVAQKAVALAEEKK